MDGAGIGLLEAPQTWHVLEFKTHGQKSFDELTAKGVEQSKPQHYAQCQLYMHWSGMTRAYYLAVNKNDDALYSERVRYDDKYAERLIRKAWDIVRSPKPLERMSEDPAWYLCRWCNHHPICHGKQVTTINCRTCLHATAETDTEYGRWSCALHQRDLDEAAQRVGCAHHRFIPNLVPWAKAIDADSASNTVEYEAPSGATFLNGPKGPCSYPSEELRVLPADMAGDVIADSLRDKTGAQFVSGVGA